MTKIDELKQELNSLTSEMKIKQRQVSSKKAELDEAIKLLPKPIEVTDHALIRHMERVMDLDVEVIRGKIITKELYDLTNRVGGTATIKTDGVEYIMKEHKLVTII